jgi:hypothetical protein
LNLDGVEGSLHQVRNRGGELKKLNVSSWRWRSRQHSFAFGSRVLARRANAGRNEPTTFGQLAARSPTDYRTRTGPNSSLLSAAGVYI